MKTRTLRTAIAGSILLAASASVEALLFRSYLASDGSDANPCTLPAPCRLLPAALAAVTDGGEIWILDSANYNTTTVNINKSVNLVAVPGAVGSIVANGVDAIDINTAGVKVALRNLVIAPIAGTIGPYNGIHVTAGDHLLLDNCSISRMTESGVYAASAPTKVRIVNSTIRDNGRYGFHLSRANGTSTVEISGSTISGNGYSAVHLQSGNASGYINAAVGDSRLTHNGLHGIYATSAFVGTVKVAASNNFIANNAQYGIYANGLGIQFWAGGNSVTGNATGFLQDQNAVFNSAGTNSLHLNGTDVTGIVGDLGTV